MKKVFGENKNHRRGKEQIAECNPFKRAAPGPCPRESGVRRFGASKRRQQSCISAGNAGCVVAALQFPHTHRAAWRFSFKDFLRPCCSLEVRCSLAVRTAQCVQRKICQPRERAMPRNRQVGLTAKAWPTAASIQRSIEESPYALQRASEIFCARANSFTASAFSSPKIAAPVTLPVQQRSMISNFVAMTNILQSTPRHRSSRSSANCTISASGASVPLISTIASPRKACHHTRCIAAGKNSGSQLPESVLLG